MNQMILQKIRNRSNLMIPEKNPDADNKKNVEKAVP